MINNLCILQYTRYFWCLKILITKTLKTYFTYIITILLLLSCNKETPVCPDSQSYDFKLGLTNKTDTVTNEIKIYNPKVGSFSTNEAMPFFVSIPVNIASDSTVFYIDFMHVRNDTIFKKETDTIAFTYTSSVYQEYQECGFIMNFNIKKSVSL